MCNASVWSPRVTIRDGLRLYRPAGVGRDPSAVGGGGGGWWCSAEISNSANAPRGYSRGYLLLSYIGTLDVSYMICTYIKSMYVYIYILYIYVYKAYGVQCMRSTAVYNTLLLFYG